MKVDVVIEFRFFKTPCGTIWTASSFPYEFWSRYLEVFSNVRIIARVKYVEQVNNGWKKVIGDRVDIYELSYYEGPIQFIKKLPDLIMRFRGINDSGQCVILRIPSFLAFLYEQIVCRRHSKKYGVEVVGDPEDVFSKKASKSLFRRVYSWLFATIQKKQCQKAVSSAYVTARALQRKYPPSEKSFTTNYSSIDLKQSALKYNVDYKKNEVLTFISIGNLSQPYKGCDFLLDTLQTLKQSELNFRMMWVGGGQLLTQMIEYSQDKGLIDNVTFLGNLSGRAEIEMYLDQADYFILPSRQEGLPRVLIEAMARGKVCISSDVGGVNELLDERFVFIPDNMSDLLSKIKFVTNLDEDELLHESNRNTKRSEYYLNTNLQKNRNSMYKSLIGNLTK
ncbi:MAG: colanic acid/amylovoran biosynthesis glycosyltransferase [Pseudohongiellaceae bacterium]|jgi:colanic acid/amylovoran biosynthesis glycosyltransferase